jgi:ketosteroid isomerase-like protein
MTGAKDHAFAVWRAFGSRDPDQIRAVLTEDVVWLAPPHNATQIALGLPEDMLESREGIVEFVTHHFRKLFPEGATFDFTRVVCEEAVIVFEQRMTGKLVNGRTYDNRYCWVFEMRGERLARIHEYMDTAAGYRMIFDRDISQEVIPLVA